MRIANDVEDGCVYFVQSSGTGLIKIGWTSDLIKRFKHMQAQTAERLELMVHGPGTRGTERDLHQTFRECRRHGEWFDPHPVLIMAIDHIRASMGPEKLAEYDCFKHALY